MLKIENESISIVFDKENGKITSLKNKITNDDYIKNNVSFPLFALECIDKENKAKIRFLPSRVSDIKVISNDMYERLEIMHEYVTSEDITLNIFVKVIIEIYKNDLETKWYIELENKDQNFDIVETLFPYIRGIYLGEDWKDNPIIYPHHAGEKTKNPIEAYTTDRYMNFFRAFTVKEENYYSREINYCGLASMMWMYYYDDKNGFYISSYDSDFLLTGLRVETGGPTDPWIGFAIRKYVKVKCDEKWMSKPYAIGINDQDWHWGAKAYRKWIGQYITMPQNPEYLKQESALNQCYNFRREGQILNKFEAIPRLYKTGKDEYNMKHMFIAGWNRQGFDQNYPEYYPDLELGTAYDLYNGCQYVKKHDGFVTFYINVRIFDIHSDYYGTLGKEMAIKDYRGEMISETYGPYKFVVLCPGDERWQKYIIDTAYWMAKSYGADGIYLDQLGSAEPFACYDETHSHQNINEFNQGYVNVLRTLKEKLTTLNPNSFLMIENCGDIYGSYTWGNLTWNGPDYDEYYNVFKYTFPEYVQINMVNPRMTDDAVQKEIMFYKDMERAILLGSILWLGVTYKFEGDNQKYETYARKAIKFREKINPFIVQGQYADDRDIISKSQGIEISQWSLGEDKNMFIIGNRNQLQNAYVQITIPCSEDVKIYSENIESTGETLKYETNGNILTIYVSQEKLSYIIVENN